ncbi:MAG TPA: cyclodeaminase/cyclohydrolase family protein, partial [Tenuifilaceae bacterium]|nr:cyclodeaminase/cyclohydrolase family protein [Tenuifilaceae bacterium]
QYTGKIALDEKGNEIWILGALKACKAIGWFIDEFGIAQVSINLTDITVTPLHIAFEEANKRATERGLRATGSEIVGVLPLSAMLDAGKYFLRKQQRSTGIPDREIIKIAVKSMGLDELYPFDPDKKIIEYILEDKNSKKLVDLSVEKFAQETASESPAPGGGSISAAMGAFGAALATMVANLSSHKAGWDERWEEFSNWAEKGKYYMEQLTKMVDEDTNAFNKIMNAFSLPKGTDEEKAARTKAIEEATLYAIEVPFKVMQLCYESMEVVKAMAEHGNPNSVTDAGVGALAARSGVMGAFLNVKINAAGLKDKTVTQSYIDRGNEIVAKTIEMERAILSIVEGKIK